jgi:hypothetical protein
MEPAAPVKEKPSDDGKKNRRPRRRRQEAGYDP